MVNRNVCRASFSKLLAKGLTFSSLGALLVGCSGGPSRLAAPSYDASGSAARAMQIYDKDGDGFVAGEELENAPALKAAIKNLDKDGDGKVSEQEIVDRINVWTNANLGMMSLGCEVTFDGALLDGAVVKFVPEEFLGDAILQAEGTTSLVGTTNLRVPKDKLPSPDMPPGIQLGLYRVEISKKQGDQELIPEKYNTHTILGQEVSKDDPAVAGNSLRFSLRSK